MTHPYHYWTMGVFRDHYSSGVVNEGLKYLMHLSPNKIWKQAAKQKIRFIARSQV